MIAIVLAFMAGLVSFPAASLAQQGPGGRSGGQQDIPVPVQPNSPTPLQPLEARPSGPEPGSPRPRPPPVFSPTPSAQVESVESRPRPEVLPQGMELDRLLSTVGMVSEDTLDRRDSALSSFVVLPRLETDFVHDSNIFRSSNATSDQIFIARPRVEVRSDWDSHALSFVFESEIGRHRKNSIEDYEDFGGTINGSLELLDNTKFSASLGLKRAHSQRGEIFDPGNTDGPTISYQSTVQLGVEHKIDPLSLRLTYSGQGYDFENTATTDNSDLDRVDGLIAFRASLEIDEGTSVFVEPSYNWKTFDRTVDSAGVLQDNNGFEFLAGVIWDYSSITYLEFALGYLRQTYDDPTLATIQGPSISARMIWNPAELWTVTLNSRRTIQETATAGQSGVLVTSVDVKIDYEFLYNTIISASASYADEQTKGTGQNDTRTRYGLSIRHLFNEYLYAQFETSLTDLSSNVASEEFDAMTSYFRLGMQL
tara:strand:- start:2121 stop:3563 length:1443 start_codon:yes stop_codon:yes gene_type:complete